MKNEFTELATKSEAARAEAQQGVEDRRAEAASLEREKQVRDGRVDLVPMPKVATRPFRVELYTESIALFAANSYRGESRVFEREFKHPETGEPILDKTVIGKASDKDKERGVLRQEHQECWYKLLKLWDEQGYALKTDKGDTMGVLKMSQYELVMAVAGSDSSKAYERTSRLLADLQGVPIRRSQYYRWQEKASEVGFTLVGDTTWIAENVDAKTRRPLPGGRSEVTVRFSQFVTDQFLGKHVKQLMLAPYLELSAAQEKKETTAARGGQGAKRRGRRSSLAPLLYAKLDHELARKDRYHVRLERLFDELGMASYRYKSKRRDKAIPAVERLNGKPIVGEKYTLRVYLREASDGKDFVLEAERAAQMQLPGLG